MKPQLNLRIQKDLEGETLPSGAIVQVRSFEESGRSRILHREPVPVSADASHHHAVTVDPGRYEVSAILPSGSVVSRVVEVTETDASVDAALDAGTSPHEWLSWQQWSGNVGGPRSSWMRESGAAPAPAPADIMLARVPADGSAPREKVWGALAARLATLETSTSIDPASILPAEAASLAVHKIPDPEYVAVRLPRGFGAGAERTYLFVTLHGQAMLCAMPWPWMQSDGSGEALVEAVISEQPDSLEGSSWSVRTTVRDHLFAGLLNYFAVGEQQTARELIEPARELLYDKMENPLAATAGAYILVGQWIDESARGLMRQDWMDWVKNLSDWFPWIPDGAILNAWLALRMRGRDPLLDEARSALLEAERRGIPIYSAGVRRLIDGLMLVAGEIRRSGGQDPDVDAALTRARQLAWQIDPGQPFTCVRLWSS